MILAEVTVTALQREYSLLAGAALQQTGVAEETAAESGLLLRHAGKGPLPGLGP